MTLIDFIIKAKLSGYTSGGEGQEQKFDDGSHGFEFKTDDYKYIDRYYGFNPFTGIEHIYDSAGVLIWVMNYFGQVSPACSNINKIYSFLRNAMSLITHEYPFRGPAKLEKDSLYYENIQQGTLDNFSGIESIHDKTKKVYFLHYHGGKMK